MTQADFLKLNPGATLTVLAGIGGRLLAEIRLGPFRASGNGAAAEPEGSVAVGDAAAAWAELRNVEGVLLEQGPVTIHTPAESWEQFAQAVIARFRNG